MKLISLIIRCFPFLFTVALSMPVLGAEFSAGETSTAQTPGQREYHVSVQGDDANDGSASRMLKTISAAAPGRRVELCARLVLELQGPDPLRGGIVCGLQVFGPEEIRGRHTMALS